MKTLDNIAHRKAEGMARYRYYSKDADWSADLEGLEIVKLVNAGTLAPDAPIWREDWPSEKWVPFNLSELVPANAGGAPSPSDAPTHKNGGHVKNVGPVLGLVCDSSLKTHFFAVADVPKHALPDLVEGALVEFELHTDETGKTLARNIVLKGGLAEGYKAEPPVQRSEPGQSQKSAADIPFGGRANPPIHLRARQSGSGETSSSGRQASRRRPVVYLRDFAIITKENIADLADKALDEPWHFGKNKPEGFQYPILSNYLNHTFLRLDHEKKVLESENGELCAFNTGLVDHRYDPIYALLNKRQGDGPPWYLKDFCVSGTGWAGKQLADNFNPRPKAAFYFEEPERLIYDIHAEDPTLDWMHIWKRVERLPFELIKHHCPEGFTPSDPRTIPVRQIREYRNQFCKALENDTTGAERHIKYRIENAVDVAVKRTCWNYKTAIPMYSQTWKRMDLLLPLAVLADKKIDLALVVGRAKVGTRWGNYVGHTVLPLDWAYNNARLVCRPDSDWLSTENVQDDSGSTDKEAVEEDSLLESSED